MADIIMCITTIFWVVAIIFLILSIFKIENIWKDENKLRLKMAITLCEYLKKESEKQLQQIKIGIERAKVLTHEECVIEKLKDINNEITYYSAKIFHN